MSEKVLLINSAYEPVDFVGQRKATSLIFRSAVEVVENWDFEFIPGTLAPAVLKLKRYTNLSKIFSRNKAPSFSRNVVFWRDKFECAYCGQKVVYKDATIDHVLPRKLGGKTSWLNCVTACFACNSSKGDKLLEKSGLKMRIVTKFPSPKDFINSKVHYAAPDREFWHSSWAQFFEGV